MSKDDPAPPPNWGRYIAARFTAAEAGRYFPGRPIGLNTTAEAVARWTQQHEVAHATLTEGSTLGIAAVQCGLVDLYVPEADRRTRAAAYLARYVAACRDAQEGAATASAITMGAGFRQRGIPYLADADLERVLPRGYLALGTQVLDTAIDIVEPAGFDDANDIAFLLTSIVLGIGIAAMSPPLPADHYRSAVAGRPNEWPELRQVWLRWQALNRAPRAPLTRFAADWVARSDRTDRLTGIRAKHEFARAISEAAGVPYGDPPSIGDLLADILPDLATRAEIVRPVGLPEGEWYRFLDMMHRAIVHPSPAAYRLSRTHRTVIAAADGAGGPVVCELGWFRGGTLVAAHVFDPEGRHTQTQVVIEPAEMVAVLDRYAPPVEGAGVGGRLVVAGEAITDAPHLGPYVSGRPLLRVSLHPPSFEATAERRALVGEHGVGLYQSQSRDGTELWETAPLGVRTAAPPPAAERAVIWVLTHGFNATLRWQTYDLTQVNHD